MTKTVMGLFEHANGSETHMIAFSKIHEMLENRK